MRFALSLAVAGLGLGCSVPSVEFYDASTTDAKVGPDGGREAGPDSPYCTTTVGPLPDGATLCCDIGEPCFGRCNMHDCALCAGQCALCCSGVCCP
jgi:hypothetical protein